MPFSQSPFDSKTVAPMLRVLDDAWSEHCRQNGTFASATEAKVARLAMAELIESAVANGLTDPHRLKAVALGDRTVRGAQSTATCPSDTPVRSSPSVRLYAPPQRAADR